MADALASQVTGVSSSSKTEVNLELGEKRLITEYKRNITNNWWTLESIRKKIAYEYWNAAHCILEILLGEGHWPEPLRPWN